jgi:hypothetical protein
MNGSSLSAMDRATAGLRRHVLRQLTHWEGAAERLDDFEATASSGAWATLEGYVGVTLRAELKEARDQLKREALAVRAAFNATRTHHEVERVADQVAHLRDRYLQTELLVDFYVGAVRSRGNPELGAQLEQFASRIEPQQRYAVWVAAQQAYQAAGDLEGELRAFAGMPFGTGGHDGQERLFQLLLTRHPEKLLQRASDWNSSGQDAADFVVANGDASQAHALVSSRGRTRTPVWTKSYNALVGLYFADKTPEVNEAFLSTLGDNTIAERLSQPVDRAQQLAGNVWFYYGSRYGEYRGMSKQGDPEDFLPSMLEQSPASASVRSCASVLPDPSGMVTPVSARPEPV